MIGHRWLVVVVFFAGLGLARAEPPAVGAVSLTPEKFAAAAEPTPAPGAAPAPAAPAPDAAEQSAPATEATPPSDAAPSEAAPEKPDLQLRPKTVAPAPDPGVVPAERVTIKRRPRTGLIIPGAILFGLAYGADIGLTYALYHRPAEESLIPLVGPLIQMGDSFPSTTGFGQLINHSLLLLSAIVQTVGAILAVCGAVFWKTETVSEPSASEHASRALDAARQACTGAFCWPVLTVSAPRSASR